MPSDGTVAASFRDPSGFVFVRDGRIYRQVNQVYKGHFDLLFSSGLYRRLVDQGLLVPHEEVSVESADPDAAYKVLQPAVVPFVSYPYEWCFSQLKDAALATLAIQKQALGAGMSLKDASAYNIQFVDGKPVLIDTLSFEKYEEGKPWVAYRQFCQQFLAPLALMAYADIRLSQLLRVHIDGIPLDLASRLLPVRTRFRFSLFTHIHLHARSQQHYADKQIKQSHAKLSLNGLRGIIESLESAVQSLDWRPSGTEWADYYEDTNYSPDAFEAKKKLVGQFLEEIRPDTVWDLGANTGVFSRIAAAKGARTISFDVDPAAVEKNYRDIRRDNEKSLLPLVLDLTNPSPGLGWENEERTSLVARGPADTVMALALIHHLAIGNNLPFDRIARFFSRLCNSLIVEFVPKTDSQVQRMLASREDIFTGYNQKNFERAFQNVFAIRNSQRINATERSLYWMAKLQHH